MQKNFIIMLLLKTLNKSVNMHNKEKQGKIHDIWNYITKLRHYKQINLIEAHKGKQNFLVFFAFSLINYKQLVQLLW